MTVYQAFLLPFQHPHLWGHFVDDSVRLASDLGRGQLIISRSHYGIVRTELECKLHESVYCLQRMVSSCIRFTPTPYQPGISAACCLN